jgi:hypothetical protein
MFHFPGASFRREDEKKVWFCLSGKIQSVLSAVHSCSRLARHLTTDGRLLAPDANVDLSIISFCQFRVLSRPHRAKDGVTRRLRPALRHHVGPEPLDERR